MAVLICSDLEVPNGVNKYSNEYNKNKLSLTGEDMQSGLTVVLSIKMQI